MEKVIETKICKCGTHFEITDKDLEFYDKVSPVFVGVKYNIPSPTLCPYCRQQRRLSFRNERKLYKRTCDATGKDIISIYSPDKSYKVYNQNDWWSDKWSAKDYAKEFDFSKTFFEQFEELTLQVPKISLLNSSQDNSEYCNHTSGMKNCYLVFGSADSVDSIHSTRIEKSNNISESLFIHNSSFIYESVDIKNSYNIKFSHKCTDCRDSAYLYDCYGCSNCFGCVNLVNKDYYIFNEKYSKEEFSQKIKKLGKEYNFDKFQKYALENGIIKFANIVNSENSFGDNIFNSKDIFFGFGIYDSENLKYCQDLYNYSKDSEDCYSGYGPLEKCYECYSFGVGAYHNLFITDCYPMNEGIYTDNCYSCNNLFGCVGLRNAEYCILNKQYTKEEYDLLVPKIIEHMKSTEQWGEFFPSSISPFGYNETVANEYYPLSKDEVLSNNFKWSDYESPFPKVEKIIPASKLPENTQEIPDDILNWAIECEVTNKPFRIIKQELDFYRKHNLPIPRKHPDQRHLERMKLRNPRKLYDRSCDKCETPIKTTYAPEREEIIYCETCYNKEVI